MKRECGKEGNRKRGGREERRREKEGGAREKCES